MQTSVLIDKNLYSLGRVAIKNSLKFNHYKSSLKEGISHQFDFHSIRSKNHKIATMRLKKGYYTF
jgi:hypothetical protein